MPSEAPGAEPVPYNAHSAMGVADIHHHLFKQSGDAAKAFKAFDPRDFAEKFFVKEQDIGTYLARFSHHASREGYVSAVWDPLTPRPSFGKIPQ